MIGWQRFEADVELRIIQRVATRGEVYALRRLRRRDTPLRRVQLVDAYISAIVRGTRIVEAIVEAFARLDRQLAEHDWTTTE